MRADLHTHSNASDGVYAPAELLDLAARRGLSLLALTDHDTTAGLADAMGAGAQLGVQVIPGVELSTDVTDGELHMLGYAIDPESELLQATLGGLRVAREGRAMAIINRLGELGVQLDPEQVRATSEDGSIGRPHIARAMIAAGYVSSVGEAFERYLGDGKPAYIPTPGRMTPTQAIALIRSAGGFAVHAHPWSSLQFPKYLPELMTHGLAGIEVYYGEYDTAQRQALAEIAATNGLLATGGSDYHGPAFKEGRELGSVDLPQPVIDAFLMRCAR